MVGDNDRKTNSIPRMTIESWGEKPICIGFKKELFTSLG